MKPSHILPTLRITRSMRWLALSLVLSSCAAWVSQPRAADRSIARTRTQARYSPARHQAKKHPRLHHLLAAKDWDKILDEDDDEDIASVLGGMEIPRDMQYNQRNCQRQGRNYNAIQQVGGPIHDVYARDPSNQVFWFVGKIARVSDVSAEQAVRRQWPLIEIHASNLRPLELFAVRGVMELWVAPGDSEMDVAYNRPDVEFTKMSREIEGTETIKNSLMGFQGEVYESGEEGFRTWRLDDGSPARPEIVGPKQDNDESREPTDAEMEQISKALEGKDINELYEEQQRRLGLPLDV